MCFEIASIRDYKRMDELFTKYRPNIVYHAAAHKHVSVMENNPEEAVKNNVFGTFTCAKLSNIYNVEKFMYISTDKAHNPCGVMGATKRIGEMIMNYMAGKSRVTSYITLRFCNIIGSNASVVPIMARQIREGGPVYVTDKRATRYFISAREAINYIVNMTIKVLPSDIFILNVEKPTSIKQLAHDIIKAHGYKPNTDIDIAYGSLRPGERLTEELVPAGAIVYEENIYKLEHEKMNGKSFYRKINLLNAATKENDRDNIKKIMMEIIPEYDYKSGDNGNTKSEYALKAEA
jgi:FlaA1/EpsC-like NDP-sugar epimerase